MHAGHVPIDVAVRVIRRTVAQRAGKSCRLGQPGASLVQYAG